MPVTTRNLADRHADDQRYQDLKRRLVAEWNDQQSDPPRPVSYRPCQPSLEAYLGI